MDFFHQKEPVEIKTVDGKLILEHIGRVATGTSEISIAHMVAPPGWSEPQQRPEFDEYTLMVRGRKRIEVNDTIIEISEGESLHVKAGNRVRYSNPFSEEAEYWSVCLPAFSPDIVNRSPD